MKLYGVLAATLTAGNFAWELWNPFSDEHNWVRALERSYYQVIAIALCWGIAGCAIAPDFVRAEATHTSHLTQHFGPDRSTDGMDAVGVVAEWKVGSHGYVGVGEYFSPIKSDEFDHRNESFEAHVGYEWEIRK